MYDSRNETGVDTEINTHIIAPIKNSVAVSLNQIAFVSLKITNYD